MMVERVAPVACRPGLLMLILLTISTSLAREPPEYDPPRDPVFVNDTNPVWNGEGSGRLERLWPSRWLIGAQKCGTTSLHAFLEKAPTLCSARKKEHHFFDNSQPEKGLMYSRRALETYLRRFLTTSKCKRLNKSLRHFTIDSTPNYISTPGSLERLKSNSPPGLLGKMRFVVLLREPVSREMSRFNHHLRHPERMSEFRKNKGFILFWQKMLEEQRTGIRRSNKKSRVSGLWPSFYDEQVARAGQLFGHKNVLVISLQTLASNSSDTLGRVLRFLDIDAHSSLTLQLPRANMGQSTKHSASVDDLPTALCREAAQIFAPHNQALYTLLRTRETPPEQPPFPPFDPDPCANTREEGRAD